MVEFAAHAAYLDVRSGTAYLRTPQCAIEEAGRTTDGRLAVCLSRSLMALDLVAGLEGEEVATTLSEGCR